MDIHRLLFNYTEIIKNTDVNKISITPNGLSFFIGDEAFAPIKIESIEINSKGENWISVLNLPSKPDRIWLNTKLTFDFKFAQ